MINLDKSKNWSNWEDWVKTKRLYYRSETCLNVYGGSIDFDPDGQKTLVGGDKITYDEYLDLQMMACESKENVRWNFARCYYNIPLNFKGEIERITEKAICFKRILVSGMYPDGMCFDGKEDHVWIDKRGVEKYRIGDCLSFLAEPYRYIKTGNGKQIDFGLRNLREIKKIEKYRLPSDEELMLQSIDDIICETCYLNEQCWGDMCIRNKKEIQFLKRNMLEVVKGSNEKRKKNRLYKKSSFMDSFI